MDTKKKGKTVEEVYREIKKMIYYNDLAPGQKLIYQGLANKLNTSTTPVVQALKRLERSKFVRYEPNKGYFVGEITETEAKELYQCREALEIYAIPMIIQNLTAEKLDSVRGAFKEYNKATPPGQRRILMIRDAQFHLKIIEYAGNSVIYSILEDLFERIYLRYRPEYLWEDRIKEATMEHRAILKSLGEGDSKRTSSIIKKHIRKGMDHIIRNLRLSNNRPF